MHLDDCDFYFEAVGKPFETAAAERRRHRGTVGAAPAILVDLRAAVDHSVTWMPVHR